jgi:hypothetical protein
LGSYEGNRNGNKNEKKMKQDVGTYLDAFEHGSTFRIYLPVFYHN